MGEHARDLKGALLGIYAQTSLHPGSGTALGVVDLPIQRERHTHWPMAGGSMLKGILRDASREKIRGEYSGNRDKANNDPRLVAVFGPGEINQGGETLAGALTVTDARIVAFPVRSLKGVFAWITCPGVLTRFTRDAALAGVAAVNNLPDVARDKFIAAAVGTCPCALVGQAGGDRIILEEFEFARAPGDAGAALNEMAGQLTGLLPADPAFAKTVSGLKSRLVVLSDDDFTYFVRHATEITARIALNYDTKTVKRGALFYQEFLPAETLMYAVLLADASRGAAKKNGEASIAAALTREQVLEFISNNPPKVLQIGGDETTGKGLCSIRVTATVS